MWTSPEHREHAKPDAEDPLRLSYAPWGRRSMMVCGNHQVR